MILNIYTDFRGITLDERWIERASSLGLRRGVLLTCCRNRKTESAIVETAIESVGNLLVL